MFGSGCMDNAIGQVIRGIKVEDDQLTLTFNVGILYLADDGPRCCEARYMTCDDNLGRFIGAKFLGAEVRDGGDREDRSGRTDRNEFHEVQFLIIHTSEGDFTCETHNEHNGCYGGFSVTAQWEPGKGN